MSWKLKKLYLGLDNPYTKTGLLHQYLHHLYHTHIKKDENEHWIREGFLDTEFDKYRYPGLSLKQLLQNTEQLPKNCSGTFVIQGSNGDGRVFSLYKIMACCIKHIPLHITWDTVSNEPFRFPIFVSGEAIQNWNNQNPENPDIDVLNLLYDSMIQQLQITESYAKAYVHDIVSEMLYGDRIVIFSDYMLSQDAEKAEALTGALYHMCQQPLSIFIDDKEFRPNIPTQLCCIDFGTLTETQIASHLAVTLNESEADWTATLKRRPDLVRILNKAERLLVYTKYAKAQSPNKKNADIALSSIYEVFIENEIKSACNNDPKIMNELTVWLQDYCNNLVDSDGMIECFSGTDMFNSDGTFKYEDCRYYLIAKKQGLTPNSSDSDIRNAVPNILSVDNAEKVLGFCACFIKKDKRKLRIFYSKLIDELKSDNHSDRKKNDAALLADVICASESLEIVGKHFIQWTTEKLDSHTYDNSILDALVHLSDVFGSKCVEQMLMAEFDAENVSKRKQRRIAYYFSYAKRGVPDTLIDAFRNLNSTDSEDRHLKYHIIDAFIDNFSENDDSFTNQLTTFRNALEDDCILKSEYDAIHKRFYNVKWLSNDYEVLLSELITILQKGKYWEKAHAAGALSRHAYPCDKDAHRTAEKMFDVLSQELDALSSPDKANINHARVVSYIVKSFCRLGRRIPSLQATIHQKLVGMITEHIQVFGQKDISASVYFSLQVALSVMTEGVLCLCDAERDVRRNMGKYYTMNDPLICAYDDLNLLEKQVLGAQDIEKIEEYIGFISQDTNVSASSNAEPEQIGKRSLVCIQCKDWGPFYGFLFAHNHILYAITCRHSFYAPNVSKFADPSTAYFSVPYHSVDHLIGNLQYPDKISYSTSFNLHPDEDIAIFSLSRVPVRLYKAVFSSDDINPTTTGSKGYSTTVLGDYLNTQQGVIVQKNNGFFNITLLDELKTSGFSGTAFYGRQGELFGMWKGSHSGTSKKCIDADIILNHIKTIERENE